MKLRVSNINTYLLYFAVLNSPPGRLSADPIFREDFADLKRWSLLEFEKIKQHSTYRIVQDSQGGNMLMAESTAGAMFGLREHHQMLDKRNL